MERRTASQIVVRRHHGRGVPGRLRTDTGALTRRWLCQSSYGHIWSMRDCWRPAGGSNPSKIRRQRIRFTSCVAGRWFGDAFDLVRSVGFEPTWFPPSRDGASAYFATSAASWRTRWDSNPRSFRAGLRDRALCRSGHWSANGGPGWFRTTCERLKRPLPLHSGLTLRVRSRKSLATPSRPGLHRPVHIAAASFSSWYASEESNFCHRVIGAGLCH
jgi:hypothetical protein